MKNPDHFRDGSPITTDAFKNRLGALFNDLYCVMQRLRRECPWDARQTPQSLRRYILEETYEVLDAIDREQWGELKDELGDFLLQVMFQSCIQAESNHFDVADVLDGLIAKLLRRHPHVFGDEKADNADQVRQRWRQVKQREKPSASILDGIPQSLPALLTAFKLGEKAAGVGFDWDQPDHVWDKICEEMDEVKEAVQSGSQEAVSEELGDLMFAVSQLARKLGCEPEETLRMANAKFTTRFKSLECMAASRNLDLNQLNLNQLEALWQEAKRANIPSHDHP